MRKVTCVSLHGVSLHTTNLQYKLCDLTMVASFNYATMRQFIQKKNIFGQCAPIFFKSFERQKHEKNNGIFGSSLFCYFVTQAYVLLGHTEVNTSSHYSSQKKVMCDELFRKKERPQNIFQTCDS